MVTNMACRRFINGLKSVDSAEVLIRVWVYKLRVLGRTFFIILRDCSGEVQCVAATEALKDHKLKVEDVVEIQGVVRLDPRSKAGFEIDISTVCILNRAGQNLPFQSADQVDAIGLETLVQY